jgi:hypothetical protein
MRNPSYRSYARAAIRLTGELLQAAGLRVADYLAWPRRTA